MRKDFEQTKRTYSEEEINALFDRIPPSKMNEAMAFLVELQKEDLAKNNKSEVTQ